MTMSNKNHASNLTKCNNLTKLIRHVTPSQYLRYLLYRDILSQI